MPSELPYYTTSRMKLKNVISSLAPPCPSPPSALLYHSIMFLKTVPPVVAVHSEWMSGKSFNLPLCFNDSTSDSDSASASGATIPHKVQMIIDSLRSTQSSDMSDNPRAPLDLQRHAGRKLKPCHAGARARPSRPEAGGGQLHPAGLDASDGSDSDDSVDRGIEEAIQEYLKEKVDHKRRGEATTSPVQGPKVQRRDFGVPDASAQLMLSDATKVLTASNHIQKGSKADQPLAALKKKKKKPSKENPDAAKTSSEVQKAPSSCSLLAGQMSPPLRVNVEDEELLDSSSDDGIEEAIQRFQREQKDCHEGSWPPHPKEESDSSSDDGIEEAIWHYQREKEKKSKIHPKPSPPAATARGKVPATPPADHAIIQPLKKPPKKSSNGGKKSAPGDREVKCPSPKDLAENRSLDTTEGGANEASAEHPARPTLSVNTTAELMCAEAILDISKTVMPAAFEPDPRSPGSGVAGGPVPPDGRSDDSSVDSEDGIEQEIQKFLELKAKMHEPSILAAVPSACSGGLVGAKASPKKKDEDDQSKMLRLSLSRKRKRKEEDDTGETAQRIFEEESQPKSVGQDFSPIISQTLNPITVKHIKQNSPLYRVPDGSMNEEKGSSYGCASPSSAPRPLIGSERNYSSDKSSSLDSDEDLDAAIKDLLKTKKKVKKKVRDMKLKARKNPKGTQPLPTLETSKKQKPAVELKILPAKPCAPKYIKEPGGLTGHDRGAKGLKPTQAAKKPKAPIQGTQLDQEAAPGSKMAADPQQAEESSSVDSDDSIEQEIRRFLAEKAKGSVTLAADVNEEAVYSGHAVMTERDVKVEEQLTPAGVSWAVQGFARHPAEQRMQEIAGPPGTRCIAGDTSAAGPLARTSDGPRESSTDTGKDGPSLLEAPKDRRTAEPEAQCHTQHQNLFLMKPETYSMAEVREGPSTPLEFTDLPSSLQNRSRIPLREVISAVCPSPPPSARSPLTSPSQTHTAGGGERLHAATLANRTDLLYPYSRVKRGQWDQMPRLLPNSPPPPSQPAHPPSITRHLPSNAPRWSPHPSPSPSHLSCLPLPPALSQPRLGASVVRLRRDQAAGVPPPARKTHPLQLRNRQEERERSEGGGAESEQVQKCVDETDVESGEERRAGQQRTDKIQQPSRQSLSTCIDPGELLSPYIALDTDQRRHKFRHIQQGPRVVKGVKRKLQFVVTTLR
ncbi:protein phosphatase 1 regulatory subunit 26 isoform X2 [Brachyhypopomus gauderio]|uniref:protein phosphatase 1 regulatory subunit 26 isoform X2 n=1 Tax=Brachyhypopomus gauderio TaxID=698409 RepID=UPI0040412DDB